MMPILKMSIALSTYTLLEERSPLVHFAHIFALFSNRLYNLCDVLRLLDAAACVEDIRGK